MSSRVEPRELKNPIIFRVNKNTKFTLYQSELVVSKIKVILTCAAD